LSTRGEYDSGALRETPDEDEAAAWGWMAVRMALEREGDALDWVGAASRWKEVAMFLLLE